MVSSLARRVTHADGRQLWPVLRQSCRWPADAPTPGVDSSPAIAQQMPANVHSSPKTSVHSPQRTPRTQRKAILRRCMCHREGEDPQISKALFSLASFASLAVQLLFLGSSIGCARSARLRPVSTKPEAIELARGARVGCRSNYSGRIFAACLPLGPAVTSNETVCPSLSVLKPLP
jgi:hypothetical protein